MFDGQIPVDSETDVLGLDPGDEAVGLAGADPILGEVIGLSVLIVRAAAIEIERDLPLLVVTRIWARIDLEFHAPIAKGKRERKAVGLGARDDEVEDESPGIDLLARFKIEDRDSPRIDNERVSRTFDRRRELEIDPGKQVKGGKR